MREEEEERVSEMPGATATCAFSFYILGPGITQAVGSAVSLGSQATHSSM